jgi:hypothetical protein
MGLLNKQLTTTDTTDTKERSISSSVVHFVFFVFRNQLRKEGTKWLWILL